MEKDIERKIKRDRERERKERQKGKRKREMVENIERHRGVKV